MSEGIQELGVTSDLVLVRRFVKAVHEGDKSAVDVLLSTPEAMRYLAVWCAKAAAECQRFADRAERSERALCEMRKSFVDERDRVRELRKVLYAGAEVSSGRRTMKKA